MSEVEGEEAPTPPSTPGDRTPADNPMDSMAVTLSMPKSIEIEMVEARSLGDYELWFGITSILMSTAVGFLISWIQAIEPAPTSPATGVLGAVTIVFALMTVAAGFVAKVKRKQLTKDRQSVIFKGGRTQP